MSLTILSVFAATKVSVSGGSNVFCKVVGNFPSGEPGNSGWLKYYSHVFDSAETDSFYRIPTSMMVKNWAKKTPRISNSQPNFQE
jgi:uncharacterized protein DUF72